MGKQVSGMARSLREARGAAKYCRIEGKAPSRVGAHSMVTVRRVTMPSTAMSTNACKSRQPTEQTKGVQPEPGKRETARDAPWLTPAEPAGMRPVMFCATVEYVTPP